MATIAAQRRQAIVSLPAEGHEASLVKTNWDEGECDLNLVFTGGVLYHHNRVEVVRGNSFAERERTVLALRMHLLPNEQQKGSFTKR